MHGKAEDRLQELVGGKPRPQAQEHPRHVAGQVARQLRATAPYEEVHDRNVVGSPLGRKESLGPRTNHFDALSLPSQDHREGVSVGRIPVDDEYYRVRVHRRDFGSKPCTSAGSPRFTGFPRLVLDSDAALWAGPVRFEDDTEDAEGACEVTDRRGAQRGAGDNDASPPRSRVVLQFDLTGRETGQEPPPGPRQAVPKPN